MKDLSPIRSPDVTRTYFKFSTTSSFFCAEAADFTVGNKSSHLVFTLNNSEV